MHTTFFIRKSPKPYKEKYKDQSQTTILTTKRYTYKPNEGDDQEQSQFP
jgi:hypothetical protein